MNSLELTKPITTESLLAEFESRFNQTMDLSKFTKEELEDTANHIRTSLVFQRKATTCTFPL